MPETNRIEQAVLTALERDPRILDPRVIAVSERGGVVNLRGTVNSFKQRRAAVEDTERLAGVYEVIDDLQVRLFADDLFDDALRGEILQRLVGDGDPPSGWLDVKVKDAWVTLS
jgi:hypothetical protein